MVPWVVSLELNLLLLICNQATTSISVAMKKCPSILTSFQQAIIALLVADMRRRSKDYIHSRH
jgi:hypothetical protein